MLEKSYNDRKRYVYQFRLWLRKINWEDFLKKQFDYGIVVQKKEDIMIVQYTKRNDKVIEAKLLEVEKKDLKKGCQIKIPEGITVIGTRAFDLFQGKKTKLKIKLWSDSKDKDHVVSS